MSDALLTSYEQLPYESDPITVTLPARLAALAILHGLSPPAAETARVLELGCASGGNLIPMAVTTPDGQFVGIDLSPRQISDGQKIVDELQLANIRLSATSILDVDSSFGEFDYIICHGVYSWVPPNVREKILEICRAHLAPNGVAYISYNVYPGWHVRGSLRAMMRYHANRFGDPMTRVAQARAMLALTHQAVAGKNVPLEFMARDEIERLQSLNDSYVFHEHLEEENQPFYFHEFLQHLRPYGLHWVTEAKPSEPSRLFAPEVIRTVEQMAPEPLEREQYFDFLRHRTFRRSVICHDQQPVRQAPAAAAIARLWCGAAARPVAAQPDCSSPAPEQFIAADETSATIADPVWKTAIVVLYEARPRALSFPELLAAVTERLGGEPAVGAGQLQSAVLHCYLSRFVELFSSTPAQAVEPGERPQASKLARLQARHSAKLTNLWHRTTEPDPMTRLLLPLLDGSRNREQLIDRLLQLAQDGVFELAHGNNPLNDPDKLREVLTNLVCAALPNIAKHGLLSG